MGRRGGRDEWGGEGEGRGLSMFGRERGVKGFGVVCMGVRFLESFGFGIILLANQTVPFSIPL